MVRKLDLQLTLGMTERRKTGFLPIACMHGWGVGGLNLGQTQVELSGLNRVFHELGPQGEWLRTYTDIA